MNEYLFKNIGTIDKKTQKTSNKTTTATQKRKSKQKQFIQRQKKNVHVNRLAL
jgi:hypothetical protein